jgi:hypothetical protein
MVAEDVAMTIWHRIGAVTDDYQRDWREIRDDQTLAESERVALGVELWNSMVADPVWQHRMLMRRREVERADAEAEVERIAAMPVAERLALALERGESQVELSEVQAGEIGGGLPTTIDVYSSTVWRGGDFMPGRRSSWTVHVSRVGVVLMLRWADKPDQNQ